MTEKKGPDAYKFIEEKIDSVPHLESLILLWNSRPVKWTVEELASRLYISRERVEGVLRDLVRIEVAQVTTEDRVRYSYLPRSEEQNDLMHRIDDAYRRDLVRISTMLHSKAASPIREFARAFRLRKEPEN